MSRRPALRLPSQPQTLPTFKLAQKAGGVAVLRLTPQLNSRQIKSPCLRPCLLAGLQMENVLADMVQRLREIELLLRTQNELLTSALAELEQIRHCTNARKENGSRVVPSVPTKTRQHG